MKIVRSWLEDYIDLGGVSDADLAARLTEIGHAVESVDRHGDESVFEIEFTSNRIDAMSHRGLARELSAALGRELIPLPFEAAAPLQESSKVAIALEAPELCSRYSAQLLHGVTVKESSPKLRHRLESAGLRPINNVVDVTNYVMLALGHPLHAFDFSRIAGARIIVRRASHAEKFRSLDSVDHELDADAVVISDVERAIALGGVIGGENSEIGPATSEVLLECAWFHPSAVRRTARRLGLNTDASYRFERGADHDDTLLSIALASRLIAEESGAAIGDLLDARSTPAPAKTIVLTDARLQEQTAGQISQGYALELFARLGFAPRRLTASIEVTVPSFRVDLHEEMDLIEELLRFFGYNNVKGVLPRVTTGDMHRDHLGDAEDVVRDVLVRAGLSEVVTYSFIHAQENSIFSSLPPVNLANALTENIASMRLSLIPGILQVAAHNRSYGTKDGGIFEVGRRYEWNGETGVRERRSTAIAIYGNAGRSWNDEKRVVDFFDLKGVVESVAQHWHLDLAFEPGERDYLKKGQTAQISVGGRLVGFIGPVTASVAHHFDLKGEVFVAELDLEALFMQKTMWEMTPVSKHPGIPMVLAFHHDASLQFATIERKIGEMNIQFLRKVGIWDRFVPPGSSEVKTAIGLFYQADDRSLTQEEVVEAHAGLARRLAEQLPLKLIET